MQEKCSSGTLLLCRMQLQLSEQRTGSYKAQVAELEARVAQLESEAKEARNV